MMLNLGSYYLPAPGEVLPPLPTLPQATIVHAAGTQILSPNPRTASAAPAPERKY